MLQFLKMEFLVFQLYLGRNGFCPQIEQRLTLMFRINFFTFIINFVINQNENYCFIVRWLKNCRKRVVKISVVMDAINRCFIALGVSFDRLS